VTVVNVRSIFRPAVVSVEADERLVDAADRGEQVIGMVSIRDLLGTAIRLAGPS
jgi:hypothetical protein